MTAKDDIATLEDGSGVSEDEVDAAVYLTFSVELAEGKCVECILVTDNATLVQN